MGWEGWRGGLGDSDLERPTSKSWSFTSRPFWCSNTGLLEDAADSPMSSGEIATLLPALLRGVRKLLLALAHLKPGAEPVSGVYSLSGDVPWMFIWRGSYQAYQVRTSCVPQQVRGEALEGDRRCSSCGDNDKLRAQREKYAGSGEMMKTQR